MKIHDRVGVIAPDTIEQYKKVAPATLGHMKDLRFMHSGIKPAYRGCKLVGTAVTVRAPGGVDIEILNKVTDIARPGDVIVVDRCGDTEHAVIGEFRALKHLQLGIGGWVVDGAICDVIAIGDMGFPTFSRTISALVGKPVGLQGEINTPVNCGGVVVNPGDLIVADDDGVVVLSPEEAEAILPVALEKEAKETAMREQYADLLYRNRRA
jgi:4-hydroxy-4-methyl-2-oxoglutarate aldolase